MAGGENAGVFQLRRHLARDDLLLAQPVDLVAEKFDADGDLRIARGENFHYVAAHAEGGAGEVDILPLVLQFDEAADEFVARYLISRTERDGEVEVLLRRAQPVDAGNGGDDHHVVALAEGGGRGVAQLVDLVIDGHILFYIGIRAGNVAFGLIIVVIGYEVLHPVVRKKLTELVAELRRERLVVRDDEGGPPHVFYDVRHRERLAAARDADEHLRADTVEHAFGQFFDRLRLVARRFVRGDEVKICHIFLRIFYEQTFAISSINYTTAGAGKSNKKARKTARSSAFMKMPGAAAVRRGR